MNTSPESGKILWIGWGDLAKKSAQAVSVIMNQLGYDVLALDAAEKPVAFAKIEPTELFLRTSKTHHEELVRIAKRDGFDAVYVANYGHQHITSALEFQHSTPLIIVAKPLDTHLDLLLTMSRDHTNFAYLLEKIVAHDHYLNKPGVVFLRKLMPKLH